MNIFDDPQMQLYFSKRKNIGEERKRTYKLAFEQFYRLFGLTPSEMIKEAKLQQQPDWDKKIFLEMEERNVTRYLDEYYNYLKYERKNKDGTIKNRITTIRTFYEQFDIKLPKAVIIRKKRSRVRKTDICTWDHVKESLEKVESLKYKAIILFIATSGLRIGDVVRITIGDFLQATEEYHDGTIENLLKQDPSNIIPSWDMDPQKTEDMGNFALTFNTPESVKYIFNYLNQRISDELLISNDSPLFMSNHSTHSHFYLSKSLSYIFRETINPLLGNHKDKQNMALFRPHNLRKLFETTCNKNIGKAMFSVEESKNEGTEWDIVALLTGHKPYNAQIKHIYDAVEPEDIKPYYEQLIPYLSVEDTDVKTYKSQEVIMMEERVAKLEAKESKKKKADTIIDNMSDEQLDKMLEFLEK